MPFLVSYKLGATFWVPVLPSSISNPYLLARSCSTSSFTSARRMRLTWRPYTFFTVSLPLHHHSQTTAPASLRTCGIL
ncbi:hypothetical protein BC827DRAFT_391021 [Russula dissimulans]|nr:hypothetical protein BC827DRAFT_391021 [Russula dissimulans]